VPHFELRTVAPQQNRFGGNCSRIRNFRCTHASIHSLTRRNMNGLIYLIGLIVVIMAILSFLGLH
jgi:hypothetical protein